MSNEEQAKVLRSALQAVGISGSTAWDDLAPDRQTRHIRTIEVLRSSGYCIVAVDDLTALLDEIGFWAGDEICRPESVYLIDRIEALIGGE